MELWHGGTIYTMQAEGETVEAVLVQDGIVHKAGTYNELKPLAIMEVDLQGGFMYPGLVDSHQHLIGHGEKLLRLDLSKVTSSDEMKKQLITAAEADNDSEWVVGDGWDENNFPDRKIFHRVELDEITDRPMVLRRVCRHAVLANSKALELAGITKETEDPEGGLIVRDADGAPTGFLHDAAQELMLGVMPEADTAELTSAVKLAVEDMLSLGLTGSHTEDMAYYGEFTKPLGAFKNVIGNELKFRVHLLRHHTVFEEMNRTAEYKEPYVEPGAMKIFADGALGGRTALLAKPYTDNPSVNGVAIHSEAGLKELVKLARSYGEAVAIHVIGDLALDLALTALEAYPVPEGKRDRLIHTVVASETLIDRMKKLDVALDLQPQFVTSDFPWAVERLGHDRIEWSYAWKKLLQNGLICAGGSDAPVEDVDPLLGIHAAVARRKPGETHGGYMPQEKLSRFEAIGLYTVGSAAAIGKEDTRGLIKEGYDADFTVFDRDLFSVEEDGILEAKVEWTVVAGEVMYRRGEAV
ncbi:amidohydrolase [Planococcus lenghuensis]|uniref:Amidohydrolase n=1 Tax=Planococcus lenghuensis TaxID=2213202 RepID=A0A1Q2L0Y5_9BACL|nr:amidohydrolase [Planococcus lenghuensis]AQQ53552.1 amidohydrolase [Planococcus lenghuensis]